MALIIVSLLQFVIYRHAIVKNKTLALPLGISLRLLFKIFQYPALEVKHIFEAILLEVGRRFFATYAPGAEHRNFLMHFRVQVLLYVFREFSEGIRLRIQSVLEGAYLNFVLITRIEKENFGICYQRIPILRVHIGAYDMGRVYILNTHGYYLFLQLHLGPIEGVLINIGFLRLNASEPMILCQPGKHAIDTYPASSDCAINSLGSEQQCASHFLSKHYLKQGLTEGLTVWEFRKAIQSGDNYPISGIIHNHPYS